MQRALLQWFRPDKKKLVIEALKKAGREDLIGYGPKCLVRPYGDSRPAPQGGKKSAAGQKKSGRPTEKPNTHPEAHKGAKAGEKPKPFKRKAGWAKPKRK